MPEKTIEAILEEHTPRLMSLPGVVGAGEGRCAGAPCIKVLVMEKTDDLVARIGSAIEGYAVRVCARGPFFDRLSARHSTLLRNRV